MRCRYCDSIFPKIPADKLCPNCGAVFMTKAETMAQLTFPDPPVGVYKSFSRLNSITISGEGVTFSWKDGFKRRTRTIPFSEVARVSFVPGAPGNLGFLCVREWAERNYPVITDWKDAVADNTSIVIEEARNEKAETAYEFLKRCAKIVNDAYGPETDCGIPFGRYPGVYGYLEIGWEAVTIRKKKAGSQIGNRVIPYTQIAEVAFSEQIDEKHCGLRICTREEAKIMEMTLYHSISDDSSLAFCRFAAEGMHRVYDFLRAQIQE